MPVDTENVPMSSQLARSIHEFPLVYIAGKPQFGMLLMWLLKSTLPAGLFLATVYLHC
jgi:hypothetical protein